MNGDVCASSDDAIASTMAGHMDRQYHACGRQMVQRFGKPSKLTCPRFWKPSNIKGGNTPKAAAAIIAVLCRDQGYLRNSQCPTGRVGSRPCLAHQDLRLLCLQSIPVKLPERRRELPKLRKGPSLWIGPVCFKPEPFCYFLAQYLKSDSKARADTARVSNVSNVQTLTQRNLTGSGVATAKSRPSGMARSPFSRRFRLQSARQWFARPASALA